MHKNLVIVESPAKAKTIKKYLGKDFEVLASYGHVCDLVPKEGAVDPERDFAMKYQVIDKNEKHLEAIAKAASQANVLYLATDPDREGEAISWHIRELLKHRLENRSVRRVVFHEITQRAITEAFNHYRDLSMDLVNAQQARRALDYLVGFNLSPLLWKKIRSGLSAGRVQSPALRMIVEREEEIEHFQTQEYWSIEADVLKDAQPFSARLVEYEDKKLTQFSVSDADTAQAIRAALLAAAAGHLTVTQIDRKKRKRNPPSPFTTSTLQQEASRKLGFSTQRTMRIAQQLYEGIDVGSGAIGLITYMRTDSVNLASEAVSEIRDLIGQRYGQHNVPAKPTVFRTKAKNAQEAHEAIRPTSVRLDPDTVKQRLTTDQYKLYELIWKRTVACQMIAATLDTVAVYLSCGSGNTFRANGSTIADPGFMVVYQEGMDESRKEDGDTGIPPSLREGEQVKLVAIRTEQHFTEPPLRYTEASLVKALEEFGIGRPSTYANIIATLQQRKYALLQKRCFVPTDVGRIVNRFLTQHFSRYVDYDFTARMEDELDAISRGERDWIPVMRAFWEPFKSLVDETEENVSRREVISESTDESCPKCGKPLLIRLGKRGRFIGCSGYPGCDYTRSLESEANKESSNPEIIADRLCPKCNSALLIRNGRYGQFIGCSHYPECNYLEPLHKPKNTGVSCPACGNGTLIQRKSRQGRLFYSCSSYPDCKYAVWNLPLDEPCPHCGWPILTLKTSKRRGPEKLCPQQNCHYAEPVAVAEQDIAN
jgi:DNA topoisomerase-1